LAFLEKINLGVEALNLGFEPKMPPTPFISARGIEAVWYPNTRQVDIKRLLSDVQKNHLTTRDLNIVETLFRHRYLTSHQLSKLFFDGQNKKIIHKRLDKLTNLRLVQLFKWRVNDKLANTKAYCLGKGGGLLLEVFRKRDLNGWSEHNNIKSISYIFQILMANEVYVKLVQLTKSLGEEEGLIEFKIEPKLQISDKKYHEICPTASFNFRRSGRNVEFILEVLREPDIEYIPQKLKKLNEYYLVKNFKVPPVFILITEKDSQALRIGETIEVLGLTELDKWMRMSTDVRMASYPLSQAFFKVTKGVIEATSTKIFEMVSDDQGG